MKRVTPRLFLAALMLSPFASLHADIWTWDRLPGGTTPPAGDGTVTGGAGTWDLISYNWTNDGGMTDQLWTNDGTQSAVFGGTGGAVTIAAADSINASAVTIGSGYTLTVSSTGTASTFDSITVNGNLYVGGKVAAANPTSAITLNTGSNLQIWGGSTLAMNINLNGGKIFETYNGTGTFTGRLQGTGDWQMDSGYDNVLTLSRTTMDNTFTGNTNITNHQITFTGYTSNTSFTPFGTDTTKTVTLTSSTHTYDSAPMSLIFAPGGGTGSSYSIGQQMSLNALTGHQVVIQNNDGIMHFTGNMSVTTDGSSGAQAWFITQYNGKDIFLDGVLSGTGQIHVSDIGGYYGNGAVHLSNAANTYSGSILVNDSTPAGGGTGAYGILTIDAATAAQYATVDLRGATNGGRLNLNADNIVVGGLTGLTANSAVFTTSATSRTFTVNNAADNTYLGMIGVTGTYSYNDSASTSNAANIRLVKTGAGALTLGGSNNYVGGTAINAGTLVTANSAALGAGSVTVAANAILTIGDGTTNGVTLGSGATLTINANGRLRLGDATSLITLTDAGGYALHGIIDLNGKFDGSGDGSSYTLITGGSGTKDGSGVSIAGYNGSLSVSFSNGILSFSSVPEPATYGLLGAGILGGIAVIRRRGKKAV